jgi:monoterpene epsilon-lactone hydrolase
MKRARRIRAVRGTQFYVGLCLAVAMVLNSELSAAADAPHVNENGTVHLPAISLPESSFLGDEARSALRREREGEKEGALKPCPSDEHADAAQMPAIRYCQAEAFYKTQGYKRLRNLYPVAIASQQIAGVYTEVFLPAHGVDRRNKKRILINLHGGGFIWGARTTSHLESIPIASVGKIKVLSIDYRQAPEYTFPSASEDVAVVYRELLKTYKPQNIGLYGCSAGGLLVAEAIAWFQKVGLPLPGAVGMFCEGASYWMDGDSGHLFGGPLIGTPIESAHTNPYFHGTDTNDPLVFPALSPQVIGRFPPSLLIGGTRDFALSSVVHTHSVLVAHGVEADLHIWEGLGHAFFFDPDLPQSREVYDVTVKFFDTHLGL